MGTLRHWVMGTLSASTIRSAEQKLLNKNSGKKIGGDPKCKYKKVSGTKIGGKPWGPKVQVQKGQQNKNCGTKTLEQKQQNKNWWGPSDIG